MNQIFEVCETVQQSDSDGWQRWTEEDRVSLHMTLEGAEKRVQELIDAKIAEIPKLKVLNPHIEEKYWIRQERCYRHNMTQWSVGNNGNGRKTRPYFTIHTIPVED